MASYAYAKDHMHYVPKIGVLESSNGCINHAISVCRGQIFDTNILHAMPLSQKTLDWCTSTDDEKASFVKFD